MKGIIVAGMGEMLLRLSPRKGMLLSEADCLSATYGGSEANVLISLSHLGMKTRYLSKMGDDPLSLGARRALQKNGVDASYVLTAPGEGLGLYFLEEGAGARPSRVVYRRKGSAAAKMEPKDFDFPSFFAGVGAFHLSGITLCLSEGAKEAAIQAMKEAKKRGILVFFDFNYRSSLLPLEPAKAIYREAAPYADVVFASPWDIKTLLGYRPEEKDDAALFEGACREFGYSCLLSKKREVLSSTRQTLQGFLYDGNGGYAGRKAEFEVFDRIGAGDAFAAGAIHALLSGKKAEGVLDEALANCVLEQSTFGDQALFGESDLAAYLASPSLGDVKR